MKFGRIHNLSSSSEAAELLLELTTKEAPTKVSQESGMKFGMSEATELPLELATKEAPTRGHEVLPTKASQEDGVKFGASKAELPLEYVIEEISYKDFTRGGMKFGRAHDRPSASEAKLSLEYVSKEAPAKNSREVE
ncbi:hypothetical protein COCNU_07G010030 [Cocos nucifera]|uniref:Uncharacterized protein n=1 Tax=Cocos nucifera TaxID=13894 RepID=A0A8K0N577_COCNU|nr:hypothetical protein COCNU_07G010030 [Cocos nucifera]